MIAALFSGSSQINTSCIHLNVRGGQGGRNHRIFILPSRRGDKSAKLDGQHSADTPVALLLTARLHQPHTHFPLQKHMCRGELQTETGFFFWAECCNGAARGRGVVVGGGWGLNTDHRGSDKARERAPGFKGTTASHVLSWEPVDFLSVSDFCLWRQSSLIP